MNYATATVTAADYLLRKHDPTYGLPLTKLAKLRITVDREYSGRISPEEHDRIYELLCTTKLTTYDLPAIVGRSQMICWRIKAKRHKMYDPVRSEAFRTRVAAA